MAVRVVSRLRREVVVGDCLEVLRDLPERAFSSLVTDPPAGIGFMNKAWDDARGGRELWIAWLGERLLECRRLLQPGAHALVWAIPRTSHWTATALEDAGFEVRDVVTHLFGCVTPDTEMLTAEGWKRREDLRVGELVASVLPSGALRYAPLRAVTSYPFDGELLRIRARGTDQLLTPGHRVWARAVRAKWKRVEVDAELSSWSAEELAEGEGTTMGWRLPLAARGYEAEKGIGQDFAALYGWILAEGYFHRDVPAVSVYQNEGPRADAIRALLGRLGIPHSEYMRDREYRRRAYRAVQFYLRVGPWCNRIRHDLAGEKPTPPWWLARLPREEALALFDTLVAGDGSWSGPSSGAFYQKDPRTRAWFQALCVHLGYRTTENAGKRAVSFCVKRGDVDVHTAKVHRARWCSRVPYSGEVWCPTTVDGTWVARRAGTTFVTGNTGFPKSHDVSKAIDKAAGAEREVISTRHKLQSYGQGVNRVYGSGPDKGDVQVVTAPSTFNAKQWEGWGTALKPAAEHWILARVPLEGTVAANVLEHGCGALNIDGCRIEREGGSPSMRIRAAAAKAGRGPGRPGTPNHGGRMVNRTTLDRYTTERPGEQIGRYPAHLVLSGDAPALLDAQSNGSSRFFYCPKASRTDRGEGNTHPTVKSTALMRWLTRLVTPPGGCVLDPFAGSGSTGVACAREGFRFFGVEQDPEHAEVARRRIADAERER